MRCDRAVDLSYRIKYLSTINREVRMIAIHDIVEKERISKEDLVHLLSIEDEEAVKTLFDIAYRIKGENVGRRVHLRGIIEMSNICVKNCFYCGIRKDNKSVERYTMEEADVLASAEWAYKNGYGSLVLQSGERTDETFVSYVEKLLKKIKKLSRGKLGITISLGEQRADTYRRWFEAGAHRYLLRIETSNKELYRKIHPSDHKFDSRVKALKDLRETGYQVGTGVMIGLPGQTMKDLADDIIFFKENDVDMIGMGPYIPHHQTPMGERIGDFDIHKKRNQLMLGLKMLAVTRIYLKDVNMASTTALEALSPEGRELGLLAGANVVMPNITEVSYKANYTLYDGKPHKNENMDEAISVLEEKIRGLGEDIGFNSWGDSPHFYSRIQG